MNKSRVIFASVLFSVFACTPSQKHKPMPSQVGYLKENISQAELNNSINYKRYSYYCKNFETGELSYLATYFPLWKESRLKDNFGIYFQLDGGKAYPFDHIENYALNASRTKFEVHYRSYHPIDGAYINLVAREKSFIYYKNSLPWLECKEG